jgi:(E)-4-hydroxy-3-methylbut-2-enyl-diphosphate synthase
VERRLARLPVPLKIAVMGCAVNGPGEAREADVGVAGGKGVGVLFVRGKVVKTVKEKDIVAEVVRFAERLSAAGRRGR